MDAFGLRDSETCRHWKGGEVAGSVLGISEAPSGLIGCSLGSRFWLETEVVGGAGEVWNA
jgi:hypothetical protein